MLLPCYSLELISIAKDYVIITCFRKIFSLLQLKWLEHKTNLQTDHKILCRKAFKSSLPFQVIAVARTADLVFMILDATKPDVHRDLLERELVSKN